MLNSRTRTASSWPSCHPISPLQVKKQKTMPPFDTLEGPFIVVEDLDCNGDSLGSIEIETLTKPSGSLFVSKISVAPEREPSTPSPREAEVVEAVAGDDGSTTLIESDTAEGEDLYETITNVLMSPCSSYGYSCGNQKPAKSALKRGPSKASILNRGVSFQGLEIREYDMTLGDHPSASTGPPVTLDWEYKSHHKIEDLEAYERARSPRRSRKQLRMHYKTREQILFEEKGFSETEVRSAWEEGQKVRQQRYETFTQSMAATRMEEAWESACRKFYRTWGLTDV